MAAVFSILAFATNSSAADEGFYDKDHIRGFVSFGGDFRGMFPKFNDYVNTIALAQGTFKSKTDTSGTIYGAISKLKYHKFNEYYPSLHFNVGAQYKQFLTWININFSLTQISERPSSTVKTVSLDTLMTPAEFPLYDARWFNYGADWMFGWKLLGEDAFFNLIPAVGIGFNMMNIHFTSNYVVSNTASKEETIMRDRYYSAISASFNAELEARLQFDQFSIGLYGGYRAVRYNELDVDGTELDTTVFNTDNDGDTWFVGLRLTWTFLSHWDKKQLDKI
jgi:hypothetical protein